MHICDICKQTFTRIGDVKRHKKRKHVIKKNVKCDVCLRDFPTINYMKRHFELEHASTSSPVASSSSKSRKQVSSSPLSNQVKKRKTNDEMVHCEYCDIDVKKNLIHSHERTNIHKQKCLEEYKVNGIYLIKGAFKSRIQSFKVKNPDKDLLSSLQFIENY